MTDTHLSAHAYLDHLSAVGQPAPALPGAVVCALHPSARPRKAKSLGGPFGAVERDKQTATVTVSTLGPGAAVAAMTVEMLAAVGVTSIIAVGVASGVLRRGNEWDGAAVAVIADAISDESVSPAYGGWTNANEALTSRLCSAIGAEPVTSYSTSTPFRLDTEAVLASEAAVVDMEASALFASASDCGVAAALVVVISDMTSDDGWTACDRSVVDSRVVAVALACRAIVGDIQ